MYFDRFKLIGECKSHLHHAWLHAHGLLHTHAHWLHTHAHWLLHATHHAWLLHARLLHHHAWLHAGHDLGHSWVVHVVTRLHDELWFFNLLDNLLYGSCSGGNSLLFLLNLLFSLLSRSRLHSSAARDDAAQHKAESTTSSTSADSCSTTSGDSDINCRTAFAALLTFLLA